MIEGLLNPENIEKEIIYESLIQYITLRDMMVKKFNIKLDETDDDIDNLNKL